MDLQAPQQPQVVLQVPDGVTKGDLETAKNDLRREMRLWLGAGSALGTLGSGLLGAYTTGNAQKVEEAVVLLARLLVP